MRDAGVAVWGLGPHALKNILPALAHAQGLRLAGVCSRNSEVVRAVAAEYKCAGWTNTAAMLGDGNIDVVYVSTPIGLHFDHGRAAITAGKHLWCEKPLAETYENVLALINLAEGVGVTVAEGFMYLYHPQWSVVKDAVQSGRIGHITEIACRFGIPELDRPGFRLRRELGGGAFLDVGCYPMSLASELFPDCDPEIALAQIWSDPGTSVDSAGRATLMYARGTVVTLVWRTAASYRNEVDLWGTTGSMSAERIFSKPADYVPRFHFTDKTGAVREQVGVAANHFVLMLERFRSFIEDATAGAAERNMIAQRAKLRQRIRDNSQHVA